MSPRLGFGYLSGLGQSGAVDGSLAGCAGHRSSLGVVGLVLVPGAGSGLAAIIRPGIFAGDPFKRPANRQALLDQFNRGAIHWVKYSV